MNDLNRVGFDSVYLENLHKIDEEGQRVYRISFSDTNEDYQSFIIDTI